MRVEGFRAWGVDLGSECFCGLLLFPLFLDAGGFEPPLQLVFAQGLAFAVSLLRLYCLGFGIWGGRRERKGKGCGRGREGERERERTERERTERERERERKHKDGDGEGRCNEECQTDRQTDRQTTGVAAHSRQMDMRERQRVGEWTRWRNREG